ncbi:uncharacterized protein FIBRA_02123 [Fibroporia radiculosa]|uniref:ALIX V-shaped domain-containing protein n=1 Tax=Fibroporia radiculosa TaxID=599839 RepID=J4I8W0_9APHY|nr:uncharacterized protein FIBRA_02123 [Fibroporia radiculosa]CCM00096.1 predicted protein [Fibroporia radiculosa]
MVQSVIHPGLIDPKKIIGNDAVIFGELLGWGARVAIDIYNDRRKNFLKDDVTDRAQQLDDISNRVLQSLNLPAALEALERPIGLPPSLLKKAEEVRLQSGPSRIEENIKNVQKLAHSDIDILNEAMDILDQEAEEDESFQAEHSVERLSSHEANKELIAKAERYRAILDQAAQSDELVRTKWDEWERNIVELTWDETQLEASIPSSVISFGQGPSSVGATPTQTHAHALRVLLESLDDLMRARDDLVRRATRLAELENITPRVLKAAAGIERWIEVQPSTFEDALEEELAKYDKFRIGIEDGEQRQETLLQSIQNLAKERNQQFLQSRRDDESVKEREHALQSLDLAYHMYKEIMRNLDEGLKFYNDFASVLTQFRDTCNEWVLMRRNEIHSLTQSFESLLLDSAPPSPSIEPAPPEPPSRPEQQAQSSARRDPRAVFDLPPPDSDEWETTVLPPAPAAPPAQTPARRTRKTRAVG